MNDFQKHQAKHLRELDRINRNLVNELIEEERRIGNDDGKSEERRRRVEELTS